MEFVHAEYQPSPALRPFVHNYSRFTSAADGGGGSVLSAGDPLVDRVFACAYVFLSFNFGDPFPDGEGAAPLKGRSHVVGAVTRPGTMPVPGRAELFGVTFRPGWAQHFLRVPGDELTDHAVGLDDVWGARGRALEGRLLEARTVRERIRLVEAELLRRLASAPPPADQSVPLLAGHVVRRGGSVSVDELASLSGFTRQHLARKFRHALGLGPKRFCRLVRFQNALTRVLTGPPDGWAAAALELGYYDQAHLIAEFKEFSGFTPAGLASLR